MVAAAHGHEAVVDALLQACTTRAMRRHLILQADHGGVTACWVACMNGWLAIIRRLGLERKRKLKREKIKKEE
jgi:hypothetical protein